MLLGLIVIDDQGLHVKITLFIGNQEELTQRATEKKM